MNWGLKFSSPLLLMMRGKVHLRDFLLSKQITDGQKGCSNTLSNEEETPFYNPNTVQNENDTWGFLLCISELLHLSSESTPLALYSIEIVNHSSSEKKWLSLHTKRIQLSHICIWKETLSFLCIAKKLSFSQSWKANLLSSKLISHHHRNIKSLLKEMGTFQKIVTNLNF